MKFLMGTLLVASLIGLGSNTSAQLQVRPTDADWDWFHENAPRALNVLMPMGTGRELAAYRSQHSIDFGETERYFAIEHAAVPHIGFTPNLLIATVVSPVGASIQRQLLDLHMKDRTASLESLLPRIGVRRLSLDTTNCPAITERMNVLFGLRLAVGRSPLDRIILDGELHRVIVRSGSLEMDSTVNDDSHALTRWALETNKGLSECGGWRMATGERVARPRKITGKYVNASYGYQVELPSGEAGFATETEETISVGGGNLRVEAAYDARGFGSLDRVVADRVRYYLELNSGLKLISHKPVPLGSLAAVDVVLEGPSELNARRVRLVIGFRPMPEGQAVLYELICESSGDSSADEKVLDELVNSFAVRDVGLGTRALPRTALADEDLARCLYTSDVTALSKQIGLSQGDKVTVRVHRGQIPQTSPPTPGGFQVVFYARNGRQALMLLGYLEAPDRATFEKNGYRLTRDGRSWSAGEGNGGIATYAAIGAHAAAIEKSPVITMALEPGPCSLR